jgi:hypothetical protein
MVLAQQLESDLEALIELPACSYVARVMFQHRGGGAQALIRSTTVHTAKYVLHTRGMFHDLVITLQRYWSQKGHAKQNITHAQVSGICANCTYTCLMY